MYKIMVSSNNPEDFYQEILKILLENNLPFLVGGTYAIQEYTGIKRETCDFDIFCKGQDIANILKVVSSRGYRTELPDVRWIAKVYQQNFLIDFIFNTTQGICLIDDSWFQNSHPAKVLNQQVRLMSPEEMIYSKAFRQDRYRYEGPDINHLILKLGKKLNWKRLLDKMEPFWEVLLAHLINFRFVYPSEYQQIPKWVMKKLIQKVEEQLANHTQKEKVCRGTLLAIDPYKIDIEEWGFKDIIYKLQSKNNL